MNIQHKFDDRDKPSIFVGYPYGQKGYRIYDFKTHQIYVSRDIIFHESIFPYHDLPSPSLKNSITITLIDDDGTFDYTTPPIVPTEVSSSDSIPHNLVDYSNGSPVIIPTPSQLDSSTNSPSNSNDVPSTNCPSMTPAPIINNHPQRFLRPAGHLKNYICNYISFSTDFQLANYLSLSYLSLSHRVFLTNII